LSEEIRILKEIAHIATPQTLRLWFRALVAKNLIRVGIDGWGDTRIRDVLNNLGFEISRDTVANILKDNGIEPAPERGSHTKWSAFLERH
jgi:hypothetical protein